MNEHRRTQSLISDSVCISFLIPAEKTKVPIRYKSGTQQDNLKLDLQGPWFVLRRCISSSFAIALSVFLQLRVSHLIPILTFRRCCTKVIKSGSDRTATGATRIKRYSTMDDAFHISTRQRCNDDCLSRFQSESATSIAPPFCKTIKPNYFFCSRSSVSLELGLRCLHNLTGIKSVNLALSNYSSIISVIILLIMQRFLTTEFIF